MGIVEDVLVKAENFVVPVNFVDLDREVDREVPTFPCIGKTLIDVHDGKLTFELGTNR